VLRDYRLSLLLLRLLSRRYLQYLAALGKQGKQYFAVDAILVECFDLLLKELAYGLSLNIAQDRSAGMLIGKEQDKLFFVAELLSFQRDIVIIFILHQFLDDVFECHNAYGLQLRVLSVLRLLYTRDHRHVSLALFEEAQNRLELCQVVKLKHVSH